MKKEKAVFICTTLTSAGLFWNQDFNKQPLNLPGDITGDEGTRSYFNVTNGGSFIETNKRAPGVSAGSRPHAKTWVLDVNGPELVLRDGPGLTASGFLYDKFRPEPTQNITVGSKKTQPGQRGRGVNQCGAASSGKKRKPRSANIFSLQQHICRTRFSVAIATIGRNQKHLKY